MIRSVCCPELLANLLTQYLAQLGDPGVELPEQLVVVATDNLVDSGRQFGADQLAEAHQWR
jgi:hypothetical protein